MTLYVDDDIYLNIWGERAREAREKILTFQSAGERRTWSAVARENFAPQHTGFSKVYDRHRPTKIPL